MLGIPQYVWYVSMPWIAPKYYRLWPSQTMLEEKGQKARADLDMLSWIDSGDPPVYLNCHIEDAPLTYPNLFRWACQEVGRRFFKMDTKPSVNMDILHHPAHTRTLERACKEKGVSCVAVYRDTPQEKRTGVYDFLLEQLHRP